MISKSVAQFDYNSFLPIRHIRPCAPCVITQPISALSGKLVIKSFTNKMEAKTSLNKGNLCKQACKG